MTMPLQFYKLRAMPNKTFKLILASQSPRRREILKNAGFACMAYPSNSSELFDENLNVDDNLSAVAELKVETVLGKLSRRKQKGILILGADTIVLAGKQVLGKPRNSRDARRMLSLLSGKTHSVKTAFSIYCPDQMRGVTRVVTTLVGFRKLSSVTIARYISSGEPFDKAGAYAIQGLAQQFVTQVHGDLLNVVGLPLADFEDELRKQRWHVKRARLKTRRRSAARSSRAHSRRRKTRGR